MKVGRARAALTLLWGAGSSPVFITIVYMTVMDRFGTAWETPWTWISPLLFPILGLIIMAVTAGKSANDDKEVKSSHVFWFTLILSMTYLATIYVIIFMQPFSKLPLERSMQISGWYLGPLQGLVTAALGKFFVENID